MFYRIFQEEIVPNLYNSARKRKRKEYFPVHSLKLLSLYETILIPKPDQDIARKYSCKPISLKNIDTKIGNKRLANRTQQYIKENFYDQIGLLSKCKFS